MALPFYPTAGDAGIIFGIILNILMTISFVMDRIRSGLRSVCIRLLSWGGNDTLRDTLHNSTGSIEAPKNVFMDDFRRQMPATPYKPTPSVGGPTHDCLICLDEFKRNVEVNRLLCGHMFHESCFEGWLRYRNQTCPLCRNDLLVKNVKEGGEKRECTRM